MNQSRWRNGQTIADILDLLTSPSSDTGTQSAPDQADKRNKQPEADKSRPIDRRALKKPRRTP
ncbi:MAG: hypothetical protein IT324_26120 [Anaerolineae bacterium]|nr:hypothetical protein [Anaerolineae bacterium]